MARLREISNNADENQTQRTERKGRKFKQKEEPHSVKYYFFLALFVFPSLAWIISVGGDVLNNVGGVFGSVSDGFVIAIPLLLPVLIAVYSKKLRSVMLKGILPIAVAALIFPTIRVYMCSPIELRNEDIGTRFSLKTTAAEFLKRACQEECLAKSKLPSSYRLSLSTPRVAIKVPFRQIVNLNLTTSAMVNGQAVKVARLLLLASWRSVKGRYHALNMIARVPLKVKKLKEGLASKQDMLMVGRVVQVPNDLMKLKGELEKQKRFMRPFMMEVYRVEPIEGGTGETKRSKEKDKQEENARNEKKETKHKKQQENNEKKEEKRHEGGNKQEENEDEGEDENEETIYKRQKYIDEDEEELIIEEE
ncbi:predicted protein [Nematostella vectensis]|uniref:Uncharacterized protein n=1 Tax=Nematostella vectensis TaxID=45351 RepID=A7RPU7_NEMVE|nr:predicted protein [Nematostella vectensis]|eukprot:XP_001638697.1 predicted protein [Nematostella vectensis]